jgi:16S rRNA (adenine1518-N6/adenine1519-N6)-dimethyltransferase
LELSGRDLVVEIGAGLGALTIFLAQAAPRVVALERDPALAEFLRQELFPDSTTVEVRAQDVLEFDFLGLARETGQALVVVGNLPYQITTPLLFKLIEEKAALDRAVLMVQEEVGDRLLAGPGSKDYGAPTVLVQCHFALRRLFSLGPSNFYPPPKVASVVLRLAPDGLAPGLRDPATFARVVRAAFAKRRKTLNNTLVAEAPALGLTREAVAAALKELDIDPGRRGETLNLNQFVALSNALHARRQGMRLGGGPGT